MPMLDLNKPLRVLYICSAARSGSTITDMFLGGHPRIASLGEANLLGKQINLRRECSCGVPVPECSAWSGVISNLQQSQHQDLLRQPYKFRLWDLKSRNAIDPSYQNWSFHVGFWTRKAWLMARRGAAEMAGVNMPLPPVFEVALRNKMSLYRAVAASWNKDVVVDSSKNPWEALELVRRWPDIVRVVLLTRDGRGVFLSRRSSGFSRSISLRGWRNYYRRAAPMLRNSVPSSHLLQSRYEDLASDPTAFAEMLCEFAGVEFDDGMLRLDGAQRHLVDGNDTRFSAGKGIRLDERWRTELVGEELAFFERHGGLLNKRLGYV